MQIRYQGLDCVSGEYNRTPGMSPNRGHVIMLRSNLTDLKLRYTQTGFLRDGQVFWPESHSPPLPFSFGGIAPMEDAVRGRLNWVGDLVLRSDDETEGVESNVCTVQRMYIDKTGIEDVDMDAFEGGTNTTPLVRVNLVDQRAYWFVAGEITGKFNTSTPSGTPDVTSLKNGDSLWTYEDLLRLAVRALATSPIITHLADGIENVDPPLGLSYDYESPVNMLNEMLRYGGFVICLHRDDTVGIYSPNVAHTQRTFIEFGSNQSTITIDETLTESDLGRVSYLPRPALVRVVGNRRRQNHGSPLLPVFTDNTGTIRHLTDENLIEAGMTIFGVQATRSRLAAALVARESNATFNDASEERLFKEAYRVFMIASAAAPLTTDSEKRSWDFTKTQHPMLPMLDLVKESDAEHPNPYQVRPVVRATRYTERVFNDATDLDAAIDKFIEFMAETKAEAEMLRDAATSRLEEELSGFGKFGALQIEFDRLVSEIETPNFVIVDYSDFEVITDIDELAKHHVFERTGDFPAIFALQRKIAAAAVEKDLIVKEIADWQLRIARIDEQVANIQQARDTVVDNVEFKKFFKMHFTVGNFQVPDTDFQLADRNRGIIVFKEPMFTLKGIAVADLDASDVFEPDITAHVRFSYELKHNDETERVSYLFQPSGAGAVDPTGVVFVGKNARVDVPPFPIFESRLWEYLAEDGTPLDAAHDEGNQAIAAQVAQRFFNVPRSQEGESYRFAHFWRLEAVPPVTNLVVGTEGDIPRTFVSVNDAEAPLLGYPSQRQNEDELRKLLPLPKPIPDDKAEFQPL